ncbi:MAG TPA: hypothetical protein VL284_13985 [Thermoanaerobaculia bacterium]|nr:hypothetical protein [Thermoanaerobaculia bacterium]
MAKRPRPKSRSPLAARRAPIDWPIVAALAILTLVVYAQVLSHEFLNYDDGQFVTQNEHVLHGLTSDSIGWAIGSAEIGWYPITWMSHMLDVQLWDMHAGMHLMTNVVLHILSTLLLFLALQRMTSERWPSAFVAAIFAIHPAHVESVAWVSERKDTLSTAFAMLAIFFYAAAPEKKARVFFAMALSLMAKQMYITLPFVLLLLDFWPLRRGFRIKEKIPLFALTILGAVMAVAGQKNLQAMQSIEAVPLASRWSNAAFAYVRYIGKFFVPVRLAAIYPFEPVSISIAAASALVIAGISIAAFLFREKLPHLFTGWFWFLGTLVPVIGIVQIGPQAIADRYTYFAFIGLSIAAIWSIPRRALVPVASIAVVAFAAIAFQQVGYWRNTEALFDHTIAVTPPNALAEYSLGQSQELTRPGDALLHLGRAIRIGEHSRVIGPNWLAQAHVGAGTALMMKAHPLSQGTERAALINQAVGEFQRALALDPNAAHARNNIALAAQWLNASAPQSR